MRILQLDAATSFRGGERQVLALAEGLRARGHSTCIVSRPGSALARRASDQSLDLVTLPLTGGWDLPSAYRLHRLVKRYRADLLHAHDAHTLRIGLRASRWSGRPLVLSRRVDFVPSSWGSGAYRRAHRVIAVSSAVSDVMRGVGVAEERLRVVHDGVDIDRIRNAGPPDQLLLELGLPPRGIYVGNVAGLTDHKGQRYLIEAAARVVEEIPDVVFLIAGEGELRPQLTELIHERRLDGKVVLLGFLPEVERLYRALDLFVMSSHLEGLGSAVLEAMAASVPVVVTDAGGLKELVRDRVDGRLVPAKDPVALAAAVIESLEQPDLAKSYAASALQKLRAGFSMESMVKATLSIYREVA